MVAILSTFKSKARATFSWAEPRLSCVHSVQSPPQRLAVFLYTNFGHIAVSTTKSTEYWGFVRLVMLCPFQRLESHINWWCRDCGIVDVDHKDSISPPSDQKQKSGSSTSQDVDNVLNDGDNVELLNDSHSSPCQQCGHCWQVSFPHQSIKWFPLKYVESFSYNANL